MIVTTQPTATVLAPSPRMQNWSTGVCDCHEDMDICCCGTLCLPCLMCRTSSEFGESACFPLLDMCSTGWAPPVSLAMRGVMRERYHIEGSIRKDCIVVACCLPCAWCQMARELKRRSR